MKLLGMAGKRILLAIAVCGIAADSNAQSRAVEYLDSGVPMVTVEGKRRIARPPGAVVQGVIVAIRSAVRRPSVPEDVSMEQAGSRGDLYSIVSIRVDNLIAGEAPSSVDVYWNQYVRRNEDGRALHSSSMSDTGINHPLLPGLQVVARIAPNAVEHFGGSVDREPGLWVFRARPYFVSPFEEGAFREYTFSDELKEALLAGSLSFDLEEVYGLLEFLEPTGVDCAVAELTEQFAAEQKIWEEYLAKTHE